MGLCIRYRLESGRDERAVEGIVRELWSRARALPFDVVSDLREDSEGAEHFRSLGESGSVVGIPALRAFWFTVETAGAESASFGLGLRPGTVRHEGRDLPTGLGGRWTWHESCKTQYAGLPQEGGACNFLRAHLSLVMLLDAAAELGAEVDVLDDGDFWHTRDIDRLVAELGRWNARVAALGGLLKDAFSDAGPLCGPILSHPEFERLEAEGRRLLRWD